MILLGFLCFDASDFERGLNASKMVAFRDGETLVRMSSPDFRRPAIKKPITFIYILILLGLSRVIIEIFANLINGEFLSSRVSDIIHLHCPSYISNVQNRIKLLNNCDITTGEEGRKNHSNQSVFRFVL